MLTAVHIINHLPTAALQFKVTHKVLVGEKVDYDELKVFVTNQRKQMVI